MSSKGNDDNTEQLALLLRAAVHRAWSAFTVDAEPELARLVTCLGGTHIYRWMDEWLYRASDAIRKLAEATNVQDLTILAGIERRNLSTSTVFHKANNEHIDRLTFGTPTTVLRSLKLHDILTAAQSSTYFDWAVFFRGLVLFDLGILPPFIDIRDRENDATLLLPVLCATSRRRGAPFGTANLQYRHPMTAELMAAILFLGYQVCRSDETWLSQYWEQKLQLPANALRIPKFSVDDNENVRDEIARRLRGAPPIVLSSSSVRTASRPGFDDPVKYDASSPVSVISSHTFASCINAANDRVATLQRRSDALLRLFREFEDAFNTLQRRVDGGTGAPRHAYESADERQAAIRRILDQAPL